MSRLTRRERRVASAVKSWASGFNYDANGTESAGTAAARASQRRREAEFDESWDKILDAAEMPSWRGRLLRWLLLKVI